MRKRPRERRSVLAREPIALHGLGVPGIGGALRKGEFTMQRLLTYVLAMGCVGTSAMMVISRDTALQHKSAEIQPSNDAAFRDGLYLGKLAQAAKRPMRPPVGRWSTEKDRASFAAGFRQGFGQ